MAKKDIKKKRPKKEIEISKSTLQIIRKQRGKFSLILALLLMVFSFILFSSVAISYMGNPPVLFNLASNIANFFAKFISFEINNIILLIPTGLSFFIISLLILLYRRERPYSYIKLLLFLVFVYTSYLIYQSYNNSFPNYINLNILNGEMLKSDLIFRLSITIVIEIGLLILFRPICNLLNTKHLDKKINKISVDKEVVQKKKEDNKSIEKKKEKSSKIEGIVEPKEEISSLGMKIPKPIDTPTLSFIKKETPKINDIGNTEIPKGVKKYKEEPLDSHSGPSVVSMKTMEYARQNYLERQKRQQSKPNNSAEPKKNVQPIWERESINKPSNNKMKSSNISKDDSINIFSVINERIEKHPTSRIDNNFSEVNATPQRENPAVNEYYKADRQVAREKVMNIFNARVKSQPENVIVTKTHTNRSDLKSSNNSNGDSLTNIMKSGNLVKATRRHAQKQKEQAINNAIEKDTIYNMKEVEEPIIEETADEIYFDENDNINSDSMSTSSSLYSNNSIIDEHRISDEDEVEINNYHSTAKSVGDARLVDEDEPIVKKFEQEVEDLDSGIKGLASSNLLNPNRFRYQFPSLHLLQDYPSRGASDHSLIEEKAEILISTLSEFNYHSRLRDIKIGPSVTMFEIIPEPGIKVTKINTLKSNIAMNLKAKKVRIIAPIPGQGAVGVEIPNEVREIVGFKELLQNVNIDRLQIPMVLGKTIYNESKAFDVTKSPHMLVAGSTGSGKSVCINSLICSILYSKSPREVRLIMIDPKKVELSLYNQIPHLLTPVIVDPKRAIKALDFCIDEMDRRNDMLSKMNVRNIISYNEKIRRERIAKEKMPYIVVIIDEFASLMSIVGKELDERVSRLTAMSRAVGIHLVFATQRPSVDVITGVIKNNLPTRIAFAVTSVQDSRTIIGYTGAEDLLGRGDMLFSESGKSAVRMQGVFLSDSEVEDVVEFTKSQGEPDYIDESYFEDPYEEVEDSSSTSYASDEDELYEAAIKVAYENNGISGSYLQRKFSIGYNKAARLVDRMEQEGIVGPINGSKKRELLK